MEKVRRERMTRQAKMAKGHPKGLGRGNLKEEVNSQGLQGATSFKDLSDTTTGGDASRPHLFVCVFRSPHIERVFQLQIHNGRHFGARCVLSDHPRKLLLARLVTQVDIETHANVANEQMPRGRNL